MCSSVNTIIYFVVGVIVSAVLSAPVSQKNLDDIKTALKSQIKDQEKALEKLSALAGKTDTNGLEYSKTKSFSYSNVNGAENKEQETEEKYVDPKTEDVISDAKEKVQQNQESPDSKPETSYQATVDIPSEGIHREITNDGETEGAAESLPGAARMKQTIEFTPEVVAEYLYRTGERQEFQNLLNDLVEASEITSEEAEKYEKTVMDELYKLDQAEQDSVVVDSTPESLYPQGFPDGVQQLFPSYNGLQEQEEVYPLYTFQNPLKAPEPEMYENYVLNQPVTLDEMISTLLEEWLDKAIVSGDPEAEEILSNIVDYVSRDNNPNDEAQVKAILGDIFAEALLEDLTPRIEPQAIDSSLYPLPVGAPSENVQPIVPATPSSPAEKPAEIQNDDVKSDLSASSAQDDLEEQLKM